MSSLQSFERSYAGGARDNRIYRHRLTYDRAGSSSAIGVMNTVVSMDPSASPEWSTFSALYDEFRVMGARINLISKQQGSVTALNDAVVICYDNDDSAPMASLAEGTAYNNFHLFPAIWYQNALGENRSAVLAFSARRPNAGNNSSIAWIDVGNPGSSEGSFKLYAQGLTNSTQYLAIVIEWFIEFRGRR